MFWKFIATGFLSGKLPLMPGTWGSLLAAVLLYLLWPQKILLQILIVGITFALSVLSSERLSKQLRDKDPDCVVIDEILGMEIALLGIHPSLLNVTIAFVIFRAIDIMKPYPIKVFERLPGGLGITVDDAIAGIFTNLIVRLVLAFGGFNV